MSNAKEATIVVLSAIGGATVGAFVGVTAGIAVRTILEEIRTERRRLRGVREFHRNGGRLRAA